MVATNDVNTAYLDAAGRPSPRLPQSRCWWNWRTHFRPRSLQVVNERERICWGCHHKRKFHWRVNFPDIRIPQCSKRKESNTCWRRVAEEYFLASRKWCKSRFWRASGGHLVKQGHWSGLDGCVDEWENFGSDHYYLSSSNSHAALRTGWCPTYQLQFHFSVKVSS